MLIRTTIGHLHIEPPHRGWLQMFIDMLRKLLSIDVSKVNVGMIQHDMH